MGKVCGEGRREEERGRVARDEGNVREVDSACRMNEEGWTGGGLATSCFSRHSQLQSCGVGEELQALV